MGWVSAIWMKFFGRRPMPPDNEARQSRPFEPAPDPEDTDENPNPARWFRRHAVIATWDGSRWDPDPKFTTPREAIRQVGFPDLDEFTPHAKLGDEVWWFTEVNNRKERSGGAIGYALMRGGLCVIWDPILMVD